MSTKHNLSSALLAVLLAGATWGAPQTQVIEDFERAAPDGRPLGWDVAAIGAEAAISHVAEAPASLKLTYRFTDRNGVIYLLSRSRLRTKPWSLEVTVKGDGGGQLLGVLIADAVDGEWFEYRANPPLTETTWATRSIEPKQPAARAGVGNGQIDTLAEGGGVRLDALIIRRGPQTKEQGELLVSEVAAVCDIEANQATMVDIIPGRWDGLYLTGEEPAADVVVSRVWGEEANAEVSYSVEDATGQNVGSAKQQVKVPVGGLVRVPVGLRPRGAHGHYTIRASAKIGASERHATARLAVVSKVPDGERRIGCQVVPTEGEIIAWHDPMLFRMLKRLGAGCARIELKWSEAEPSRGRRQWTTLDRWLACAKETGLPLFVVVTDPPGWLRREGQVADATALASLVDEAARRGQGNIIGWEILKQPNTIRYWPPRPQPFAYRELLAACRQKLKPGGAGPVLLNGGLSGFDQGFAGTLCTGEYPMDSLTFAVRVPRYGYPLPPGTRPASAEIVELFNKVRLWTKETGRQPVPLSMVDVAMRTSPIKESQLGQAEELARCASLVCGNGGMMFWYRAEDGDDPRDRYGLFRRDLQPKASVVTLAACAAATAGTTYLGAVDAGVGRFVHVLQRGGDYVAVGLAPNSSYTIQVQGQKTVLDQWGNEVAGGYARAGNTPVYVTGAGVAQLLPPPAAN